MLYYYIVMISMYYVDPVLM